MSLETAGCGCSLEPELLADPFFIRSLYHLAVYGGGGLGVHLDHFPHGLEVGADVLLGVPNVVLYTGCTSSAPPHGHRGEVKGGGAIPRRTRARRYVESQRIPNLFTVRHEQQQRLVDLLVEATEAVMKYQPGYVSANIHKSLDGTRVTNYAQWRSREAFEAMLKDSEANVHMQEAARIAERFEPHLYDVSFVDEA